ncbi:hypothetical protein LIER_15463 [Lithospermum erythrorhizon]|uniref:Reverse transcriptase domain-containing protein n=1 Tax=Lithospermum erythrorhizon TaxID=34254 RepID=A0AAV3Q4Z2_LITER
MSDLRPIRLYNIMAKTIGRVMTNSFSINGAPKGYICPTRGIRKGDPLSPYLFLLYAEELICMLKEAKQGYL